MTKTLYVSKVDIKSDPTQCTITLSDGSLLDGLAEISVDKIAPRQPVRVNISVFLGPESKNDAEND